MKVSLTIGFIAFASCVCAEETHPARFKIGPDEPDSVKAAVGELAEEVRRRTGVAMAYSTQPWAAKAAWFIKEKNGILAVHGSDFEGTEAAVRALAERYAASEDGRLIRGKTDYAMSSGIQRDKVFSNELSRVMSCRAGSPDWENELVTERNREPARAYSVPLERREESVGTDPACCAGNFQ